MSFISYKELKPVNLNYVSEIEKLENEDTYSIWFIRSSFNTEYALANIALNKNESQQSIFSHDYYLQFLQHMNGIIVWDFDSKDERDKVYSSICHNSCQQILI